MMNFIGAFFLIGLTGISAQIQSSFDPFCSRPKPLPLTFVEPEFDVYAPGGLNLKFSVPNINSADAPVQNLAASGFFKKGRQVVFIIHGYFGNLGCKWWLDIKNNVMKADDSTVFVVSWGGGSNNPNYGMSASSTQTASLAVAAVAQAVAGQSVFGGSTKPNDLYLYCIGHSLGAHVCGQAGRKARGSKGQQLFNRVTGLDPAGPGFEICTDNIRIDKDSATCVDIIHTDGNLTGHALLYLGTMRAWGHIDFYPNGGANQPICRTQPDQACSHNTAIEYFVLSLKNRNACRAVGTCINPMDLKTCSGQSQSMGYYSACYRKNNQKPQGAFYSNVATQNSCKLQGPKVYCP